MDFKLRVANDNGNSEHDMIIQIEGKGKASEIQVRQANVNLELSRRELKGFEDENPDNLIVNIFDNILVEISSPVCTGIYLIGKRALESGKTLNELEVGFDDKSEAELPIVNTLGTLAAYSLKKYVEDNKKIPQELHVEIDMTTALPIKEYYNVSRSQEIFENKFTNGIHLVTLILGKTRVIVKLEFKRVLVLPEASSVIFGLLEDEEGNPRTGSIFTDYAKRYNREEEVTGDEFDGKRILHVDIGGGTVDLPITVENVPHSSFIAGYNQLGASHAIKDALNEIQDELDLPNLYVQDITKYIKNATTERQHLISMKYVNKHIPNQTKQILQKVKEELRKARFEVDVILVYGGGSILMKEYLEEELEKIAIKTEATLLYIPEEYAVIMNVLGLSNVVNNLELFNYLLDLQDAKKKQDKDTTAKEPVMAE